MALSKRWQVWMSPHYCHSAIRPEWSTTFKGETSSNKWNHDCGKYQKPPEDTDEMPCSVLIWTTKISWWKKRKKYKTGLKSQNIPKTRHHSILSTSKIDVRYKEQKNFTLTAPPAADRKLHELNNRNFKECQHRNESKDIIESDGDDLCRQTHQCARIVGYRMMRADE